MNLQVTFWKDINFIYWNNTSYLMFIQFNETWWWKCSPPHLSSLHPMACKALIHCIHLSGFGDCLYPYPADIILLRWTDVGIFAVLLWTYHFYETRSISSYIEYISVDTTFQCLCFLFYFMLFIPSLSLSVYRPCRNLFLVVQLVSDGRIVTKFIDVSLPGLNNVAA
jgi:hypothetical protein